MIVFLYVGGRGGETGRFLGMKDNDFVIGKELVNGASFFVLYVWWRIHFVIGWLALRLDFDILDLRKGGVSSQGLGCLQPITHAHR